MRTIPSPASLLACTLGLLTSIPPAGCATARYRYDRLDADDGVDVRDFEDLLRDSARDGADAPGRRLGLSKKVVAFDFADQRDEYRIGKNDVLNV